MSNCFLAPVHCVMEVGLYDDERCWSPTCLVDDGRCAWWGRLSPAEGHWRRHQSGNGETSVFAAAYSDGRRQVRHVAETFEEHAHRALNAAVSSAFRRRGVSAVELPLYGFRISFSCRNFHPPTVQSIGVDSRPVRWGGEEGRSNGRGGPEPIYFQAQGVHPVGWPGQFFAKAKELLMWFFDRSFLYICRYQHIQHINVSWTDC